MKDIPLEIKTKTDDAVVQFVNGADLGGEPKKVKNKYKSTSIAFNEKQREFFELVKAETIKKEGVKKLPVSKLLSMLLQYHLVRKKCVFSQYLKYSLFASLGSEYPLKSVTTNWNNGLIPLKQLVPVAELSLGKLGLKGIILILAFHYAENELDIDLTPYASKTL